MKVAFVDVETGGLWANKHPLLQLSGSIYIDGERQEKFSLKAKPFDGEMLDAKALAVNKLTTEMIATYPEPQVTFTELLEILDRHVDKYNKEDKMVFCAYNAQFDLEFLKKFFRKNNHKFFGAYFHLPPIDPMQICMWVFRKYREELPNFKLASMAQVLGVHVDEDSLHDADYDVYLLEEIYKKLNQIIPLDVVDKFLKR